MLDWLFVKGTNDLTSLIAAHRRRRTVGNRTDRRLFTTTVRAAVTIARAAHLFSLLCILQLVSGYLSQVPSFHPMGRDENNNSHQNANRKGSFRTHFTRLYLIATRLHQVYVGMSLFYLFMGTSTLSTTVNVSHDFCAHVIHLRLFRLLTCESTFTTKGFCKNI